MRMILLAGAVLAGILLVACGDDDDEEGGGGNVVNVTLQEYSVNPDTNSADAGEITFNVENKGPDEVHEFVIIKTDLKPDALPTNDDGSANEDAPGLEKIDEIEDIAVGDTPSLTVDLKAGSYVLICNIVEEPDGETEAEAHYQEGMRTAFTVK